MGFRDAKRKVLDCLNNGNVLHEARGDIDIKNLLSTGVVSTSDVVKILAASRGNSYKSSPHHWDSNIEVHIISTTFLEKKWYVKWYFSEPDSVFISVHN